MLLPFTGPYFVSVMEVHELSSSCDILKIAVYNKGKEKIVCILLAYTCSLYKLKQFIFCPWLLSVGKLVDVFFISVYGGKIIMSLSF